MLKKTIIVLTVLLVGLLAVSAVSAADNATSDIAGADDSADQVDSAIKEENFDSSNASEGDDFESPAPVALEDEDGKLGMSDNGEILGSEIHIRGDTFSQIEVAIRQANDGDIIYLEGITYTSTGSSIIISKSITLVGQEGTVLDAQGESGICVVQADNVVIKNIKFINAKYDKGSAIDIGGNSNFSLSNCTFINNTAWRGGAIYWPAADGSITNCTFIGNSADYGGAMYTGGDGGEISNCVFINNNANYGKALDAQSYSKIYDSYFKNIPFLDITDEDSSLTLTLMANLDYSGTVFTSITKKENLKYWNGSAYVNGDDPNFGTLQYPDKNVTLEVYHSNGELAYRVSNFTDANGQIIFDYSKFNDDRYVYKAYAFDDDSNFISATGRLNDNIGDFTLLQNYINNVGENGTVNLTRDYTFTDGLDDNLKKGIIIPFNLTICGNGYTINGAKSARIFNVTGNNVAIYGINFINGYSSDDGGAIYVNGGCTLIDCIFTNNNAYSGGAVYWNTNAVGITNCTFENNHAENGDGGANHFNNAVNNVTLTGNFNNNTARYGGANNFNSAVNNVTLTGNFNNNTAYYAGGANNFWKTVDNVTLTGNFTNNHAENGDGGANYFWYTVDNVTLTGNFTNNTASMNGGANYFSGTVNNINLTGTFSNNHAENGEGGANYFYSSVTNVNLTGNFTNNTASMNGGANHFHSSVTNVTLTGNFTDNTATESGGANYFWNTVVDVILTGNFNNNAAEIGDGGANYFRRGINNVTLTGNYINNTGENVIYIEDSVSGNVIHDSIFINNAPINVNKGNIAVIDSWFGNNVTDYNVKPDVGIDLDNWLFLNGTADPNPISVADATDIIFTLSRYDGNNVSSYDNSRLIPIKLNITSTLGSVNPNLVNLNESITYTPESVGNGSVTASFENVLCTIEIENQKVEPDMSIESYPSYAGDNATVTVTLPSDAGGNVTITDADGNNYTKQVKDGTVDIEVPGLPAGENKITITYSGDERYAGKTVNSTVQVDLMPTFLTAEVLEKYQGDDDRFAVVLTDANGNPVVGMPVRIHIVGKVYNCTTKESGVATLPINLKPGIYNVTVEFAGKGDYANATPVSSEVHVLTKIRIDKNKDLVKDYGDADKFTVRLLDEYGKPVAGEVVNMTVAGKTYHCKSNADGYASLAINLKPGTYDIVCEYAGYKVTNKITVKQVLSAYNRQYKKASSYQFTATLKHSNGKAISGKTVTFTFKGKTYTATTNSKGEATITIKKALNLGTYNIAIKYLDSTITKTITIK